MRTKTDLDTALLASPHMQRSVYIKAEIDRTGAGAWVDLANWNGLDFVRGLDYGEDINTPAWTANLNLAAWLRDDPGLSIGPGMTLSLPNTGGVLLQPNRPVRISTATVPDSRTPVASDYVKVFQGRVDVWRQTLGTITVNCRDEIAHLQDRFIGTSQAYGSDDPSTATANFIEEIIQNILDDHINTTPSALRTNQLGNRGTDGVPWQLYGPTGTAATPYPLADATTASVRLYNAEKRTIWQAVWENAQTLQYNLRRRWHEGSGINDFVLVLESPNRGAVTPDLTLDPALGQCVINSASLSIDHIRNAVVVGYQLGAGSTRFYTVTDPTSIGKYGERPIQLNLGASSQCDTLGEAMTFGDSVLADLKDPIMNIELSMPYAWYVQLNDLVRVKPDGIHIDAAQDLAVMARRSAITAGGAARTVLQLQGKPKAATTANTRQTRQYTGPNNRGLKIRFAWGNSLHPNGNFAEDEY